MIPQDSALQHVVGMSKLQLARVFSRPMLDVADTKIEYVSGAVSRVKRCRTSVVVLHIQACRLCSRAAPEKH